MTVLVKICGITRLEDAEVAIDAGADALGLNFWSKSPRRCTAEIAARVAEEFRDRVRLVGVTVDATSSELDQIRALGIDWLQLHGQESEETLRARLPHAFRAVHVSDATRVAHALALPGDELLVDARTETMPGGTGQRCDWTLAAEIALSRAVWLAGGLDPSNVEQAVREVRPFGVDVASGVERSPGVKDHERVRAFIRAAKAAE